MTDKELLDMRGVEFIYVTKYGEEVEAYVKAVDIKKRMVSCWSKTLYTKCGVKLLIRNHEEKLEGSVCLCWDDGEGMIERLKTIRDTGRYEAPTEVGFFTGCPL